VAEELCMLLHAEGHTAHHYLAIYERFAPYMRPLYGPPSIAKIIQRLHKFSQRHGLQEIIPYEALLFILGGKTRNYDIVHFHDIASTISPLTIRYISRLMPTVWTFHDCAGYTGGCIFPMDCEKFKVKCNSCPQMKGWPLNLSKKNDLTGFIQRVKRRTASENRFTVIAPCKWMAERSMSSGFFSSPPVVIPYGIDVDLYKPIEKRDARQKLGLPQERYIVLISAGHIADKRKGAKHSLEVLKKVKQEINPHILVIGKMDNFMRKMFNEFEFTETGYLKDDEKKAEYYSAADVFLFCPLDDNMPLTILETMATCTPMVGFATGGIPEMFVHDKSGYLVPKGDIEGVAEGLRIALLKGQASLWGEEARKRVEKYYTHQIFLKNHLQIYREVINNRKLGNR